MSTIVFGINVLTSYNVSGAAIYFGYGLRHSKGGHMYSILPNEHHGLLPDTPTDGLNNLRDQPAVLSDGDAPLLQ